MYINKRISKGTKCLSGIAAILMLAVSVIGCKHNVTNNRPETFSVTFGVEGVGGTLKATVDGSEINSGNKVEHGKTVTFTATPNDGFKVKGWTLDGATITEAGTNTEYKLTVTKPATVSVSFEAIPKHAITFGVEGGQSQGGQSGQTQGTAHGTLKAKVEGGSEINSGNTVEHGKTVTFTATPDAGYTVKEWKADGAAVTGSTSNTYTCTVTKALTVKVSFLAGGASYTVKHYQEKAEGGYPAEPTTTENLTGTVGTNAAYTPKTGGSYEGFICNSSLTKVNGVVQQTGTIAAGNSTVVELFYERNTVSLTFHLAGGNIEGKTDDIVKTGKYGTPFTAPADPAKATGIFKGWKPALPSPLLFPASNAEHTAEWTPKALLTLEAGKNTVKVKAKTADGKPITVEGCNETELANEAETTLTVTNPERKLALIGELTELNCRGSEDTSNRSLVALDVSGCTALQKLDCAKNQLTALDVQGLKDLQELNCRSNQIPELDVHGLTALQKLNCTGNKLTTLNVQGLTALKELDCQSNKELTALHVHGCTALQKLNCQYNKIAELDVSGLTALQELDCNTNQLKTLNVSGLTALQELDCNTNQLKTLNVKGLTALQELSCSSNQLTELNVKGLTALQELSCSSNQLTELNVQGLTKLQQLYCSNNQLTALNVQSCTALKKLECFQNKLNADAFTKLFNDLPAREVSDKAKALLYADQTASEENCKNFSQPETLKKAFDGAKAKHWRLQKAGHFGFGIDI